MATKPFCLSVRIRSNYGGSEVSLSALDVLDEAYHTVEVIRVKVEPEVHGSDPMLLVNGPIIREGVEWRSEFPENGMTIQLFFIAAKPPFALRVWNGRDGSERNVKSISVSMGAVTFGDRDVPQSFGVVVSLVPPETAPPVAFEAPKNLAPYPMIDQFGEIPAHVVKEVRLMLHDSYSGADVMGLNALEIYEMNGSKVSLERNVARMAVLNAAVVSAPQKLFRKDIVTLELGEMFVVQATTKPAILVIEFNSAVPLAHMIVWNYNASVGTDDYGIRRMSIVFDNRHVWAGKIRSARGVITHMEQNTTSVWFTDVRPIRSTVKRRMKSSRVIF